MVKSGRVSGPYLRSHGLRVIVILSFSLRVFLTAFYYVLLLHNYYPVVGVSFLFLRKGRKDSSRTLNDYGYCERDRLSSCTQSLFMVRNSPSEHVKLTIHRNLSKRLTYLVHFITGHHFVTSVRDKSLHFFYLNRT